MKILIAPDSFKGSLSAQRFCEIARDYLPTLLPQVELLLQPLADGGEGTTDALLYALGGERREVTVTGVDGQPRVACYGCLPDGTAVIELAAASGLAGLPANACDPWTATSRGTGELLVHALDSGCQDILLGLGGSATHDAGAGLLQALGYGLLDNTGRAIGPGARGLLSLRAIEQGNVHAGFGASRLRVACDVDCPLLGPQGATALFARQKGAHSKDLPELEAALVNFAKVCEASTGRQVAEQPGAGAAGGVGAALGFFSNAEFSPGFELIATLLGLPALFEREQLDLVLTGEGRIDDQTAHGKLPAAIAQLARRYGVPTVAACGSRGEGSAKLQDTGIAHIAALTDAGLSEAQAMCEVEQLFPDLLRRLLTLALGEECPRG